MKSLLQIACLCMLNFSILAQNVTILPSGITPAGSNWPSLSYEDIMALPSPQRGNMAIDITFDCLRFYNGKKWVRLLTEAEFNLPSIRAWSEGGASIDKGADIAVDNNGNIYVTGTFTSTSTFGNTTLVSNGQTDIFIVKYNKNGDFLWAKKEGGAGVEDSNGMAVDANGNIFIAGNFSNTLAIGNTTLTSVGFVDFFVAKYDTNGNFKWAQSGGGSDFDIINRILTDTDNNVYVGGNFRNTASFNAISVVSAGKDDIFLAKYNNAGAIQWVQKAGSTDIDNCEYIAIDADKNIYLTGDFYGTVNFGNIPVVSNGSNDMFIAKYNTSTAAWAWAKKGGGSNYDTGKCIAISNTGNVYVTGEFSGMGSFGNTSFTSAGSNDIFIVKYNADGDQYYATKVGGENYDTAKFIGVDANDNLYLIGSFQIEIKISSITLVDSGFGDLFIAKYNPSFFVQWAQRLAGSDAQGFGGGVMKPDGNIYLTGYFSSEFNVGTTPLSSVGSNDVFVARIKE